MLSASQLGRESELSDDKALRCTFCKRFVKYKGSIGTIRYNDIVLQYDFLEIIML